MAYRQVCFRIDCPTYRAGWHDKDAEKEFWAETRGLFQAEGWTVRSSTSNIVTLGDGELYLHPQVFSGVIREKDIEPLKEVFSRAKTFQCYHIDLNEEYAEMSDEEYLAALDEKRDEITDAILDRCRTKRRNLFIVGPVEMRVAEKFSIRRVCDKEGIHNLANKYVHDLVEQLLADGRLDSAQTPQGFGLRTTGKLIEQVEGQLKMTMGGM